VSREHQAVSSPIPHGAQSRYPRRRMIAGAVAAAAGLGIAALLTGCGAGQITQTSTQQPAVNGASGSAGAIAIRDAQLAYPVASKGVYQPGSSADLVLTIVNTGLTDDQLVKITTPAALSVSVDGSPTGAKDLPGGFAVRSGTDLDDETVTTTAAPTTTEATPTGTVTETPLATSAAPSKPSKVTITLQGIRSYNGAALRAGLTIPITFYFAHAGNVTIDAVPIGAAPDAAAKG
jgi:copper(I)-binding protein